MTSDETQHSQGAISHAQLLRGLRDPATSLQDLLHAARLPLLDGDAGPCFARKARPGQ
jgi:hypothetical protein